MTVKGKKALTNCETCSHYVYDEDYDQYTCEIDLDEDEMEQFLWGTLDNCPYYQPYDEYKIVQKQN